MMEKENTNILILGAGIGGYETFRSLSYRLRRARLNKKITIVDQHNYFTFVPLLHEVAVGAVEPSHCAISLQELVMNTPHRFIKARIKKIDPEKKQVTLDCSDTGDATISYDVCVAALGSTVNYFDIPGAPEQTYHIRSLDNALAFRNALINRFDSPDQHITISIIGGGASGVEVAGQIAELARHDLKRLYPHKDTAIKLIERGEELASFLPPRARALIKKRLQRLGVDIVLKVGVKKVAGGSLILTNGGTIESDLTLWTAGLSSNSHTILGERFCRRGRIPVTNRLQHPDFESLYAIGDNAECFDEWCQVVVPQLGEAAHREGEYVAKHIVARLKSKKIQPFHFKSKGTLMPIGDRYGLIIKDNFVLAGFWAWAIRRLVYVWFMPGVVRKLKIISDWILRLFGFADIISIASFTAAAPPNKK